MDVFESRKGMEYLEETVGTKKILIHGIIMEMWKVINACWENALTS